MQMNQKGEIVTIAVIATFVILSIATIAASALTQNKKSAFTSSIRAADSCYVGKACDVPACNDTIGGNSAKCSECGGGWCRGGLCASCGNDKPSGGLGAGGSSDDTPGDKNAEGKYKCRQRDNTNAPYCSGGKSFIDTFCDGCAPEKGCKEVETCYNGVAQAPPAQQPPAEQPPAQQQQPAPNTSSGGSTNTGGGTNSSCSSGYNFTNLSTCKSECDGNCAREGTKNCYKCEVFQAPDPSTYSCSLRVYFKDDSTNQNLKDVTFTFTPATGTTSGGTGTLTDYYSTGIQYKAGKVKVEASLTGYYAVNQTITISPKSANSICEATLKMTKNTGGAQPKCPAPGTKDSNCDGKCPGSCSSGYEANGLTCYTCPVSAEVPVEQQKPDCAAATGHICSSFNNCGDTANYEIDNSGGYACKDATFKYCCRKKELNPNNCTDSCLTSKPDGYEEVPGKVCANGGTCYKKGSEIISIEVKNAYTIPMTVKKMCVTDNIGLCLLSANENQNVNANVAAGGTYVNSSMLTGFCKVYGKSYPTGQVWVGVNANGIEFGHYFGFTCGQGQDTFIMTFKK